MSNVPGADKIKSVVKVGFARGFVVRPDADDKRHVITAAHCLPSLPQYDGPALGNPDALTYLNVLGLLDAEDQPVSAEFRFVELVADIAVLGSPDRQDRGMASEFERFTDGLGFTIQRLGTVETGAPLKISGWMLSLANEWIPTEVEYWPNGPLWTSVPTVSGMSGAPILSDAGKAIGVVCAGAERQGGPHANLSAHLPMWFLLRHRQRRRPRKSDFLG